VAHALRWCREEGKWHHEEHRNRCDPGRSARDLRRYTCGVQQHSTQRASRSFRLDRDPSSHTIANPRRGSCGHPRGGDDERSQRRCTRFRRYGVGASRNYDAEARGHDDAARASIARPLTTSGQCLRGERIGFRSRHRRQLERLVSDRAGARIWGSLRRVRAAWLRTNAVARRFLCRKARAPRTGPTTRPWRPQRAAESSRT